MWSNKKCVPVANAKCGTLLLCHDLHNSRGKHYAEKKNVTKHVFIKHFYFTIRGVTHVKNTKNII